MPSEKHELARSREARSPRVQSLHDGYVQYQDEEGHCRCDCNLVSTASDRKAMPCSHIMAALAAEARIEAPEIAGDLAAIIEYLEGGRAYADLTIYNGR